MKFKMAFLSFSMLLTSVNCFALGRSNVGMNFGLAPGGVTLGGEYEYLMKRHYGVSGFARFFQKDDDGNNLGASPGIFALGSHVRFHHRLEEFDFSVAPGFAILNVDSGNTDTTSLGPTFSLALTYKITDAVSVGLENVRYWVWLDEDFRGQIVDDTSLRATFNF